MSRFWTVKSDVHFENMASTTQTDRYRCRDFDELLARLTAWDEVLINRLSSSEMYDDVPEEIVHREIYDDTGQLVWSKSSSFG